MNIPFVDLRAQYHSIKEEMDHAIFKVLESSRFIGGSEIDNFEASFSKYIGLAHCITCANGTDAIEIALEVLGIGKGDEVLVPAYTWVSTASAVVRVGAIPIFVDLHPEYYTMDPSKLEEKITNRCKAIIPVHYFGLSADMPKIMEVAEKHNLKVIEDCAQSHGATIDGIKSGTYGDISTVSFYPGKNLGAYGDGGAILTNSDILEKKIRILARLGQREKHDHVISGRNSRLDNMQAAVLNVKLPYLEKWIEGRNRVAGLYTELLSEMPMQLPKIPNSFRHVFHLYVIQTDRRDELKIFLEENGVSTQIHYPKPLNQLGIFSDQGEFEVSDAMKDRILSLPIYAEMTEEQTRYVVSVIQKFYKS